MATGESQVQRVVHSIEQGNLAGLIRILLTIVGVVALALAYVFIEFKGLSAAEGTDQAQIARELAAGHGIYFRPRVVIGLIPLIICLGIFAIWIVRDYQLTKTPFGISPYAFLENMPGPDGAWMRQVNPDLSQVNPLAIRRHALEELKSQFNLLYVLLGGVIVAPLFFVSLLHRLKRTETADFRWAILLLWIFAFLGGAVLGIEGKTVAANQFHILFGPLMALYGAAFVLVLWGRLQLQTRILRTLFLGGLFVLTGFPALLGFSGGGVRINFPPYLPGLMQLFSS